MNVVPANPKTAKIDNVKLDAARSGLIKKKSMQADTKVRIFTWQWIILAIVVIAAIALIRHVMFDYVGPNSFV